MTTIEKLVKVFGEAKNDIIEEQKENDYDKESWRELVEDYKTTYKILASVSDKQSEEFKKLDDAIYYLDVAYIKTF